MTSGTTACSVTFDQAGNSNYLAVSSVTETVTAAAPTFAPVRGLTALRHGTLVTVRWHLASEDAVLGFEIFTGRHQLSQHLIHVHGAAMYRATVRDGWHAPLTLRVILSNGQTVNLPVPHRAG